MYNHRCTKCGKFFNTENKKNYLCVTCKREYNKKHYKKKKAENT